MNVLTRSLMNQFQPTFLIENYPSFGSDILQDLGFALWLNALTLKRSLRDPEGNEFAVEVWLMESSDGKLHATSQAATSS